MAIATRPARPVERPQALPMTRDFELLAAPFGFAAEGDPDEVMVKFTSSSPSNWGRFQDPVVDRLFER